MLNQLNDAVDEEDADVVVKKLLGGAAVDYDLGCCHCDGVD